MTQGKKFRELRVKTGMNRKMYEEYHGIPYRSMTEWGQDNRTMPQYVFSLIQFRVNADYDNIKKRGNE